MNVNYSQAGRRHFDDCRTLSEKHRAGNASHLAGLAAECALKAILEGLGILKLGPKGSPVDPKHVKHIDVIWNEFQAALSGHPSAMYALAGPNPFDNWKVSHRYEADSSIDMATAERHCSGAHAAMLLLDRAWIAGDVR